MRRKRWVTSASSRRSRSSSSATDDFKRLPSSIKAVRFCGIALAAGGLGDLVLAAADLFDGLKQAPALAFELHHAIDVIEHIGRDVAIAAVLLDGLGVGDTNFRSSMRHVLPWRARREDARSP